MAYNTGNAIGSTSPKDLSDNARNLDLLVLGPLLSYPDRRGVNRLSWAGIEASFAAAQAQRNAEHNADQSRRESEFDTAQLDRSDRFDTFIASSGYDVIGDYASQPVTFTERNQLMLKDGELWKPKASVALPYVTTGVWASESAGFVSVGDAALRQELAASGGSALVTHSQPSGTPRPVADVLNDVVSLASFGADPTGVTLCDAAVTAARSVSKIVYVPEGTWRHSNPLNLPADVYLYGPGKIVFDKAEIIRRGDPVNGIEYYTVFYNFASQAQVHVSVDGVEVPIEGWLTPNTFWITLGLATTTLRYWVVNGVCQLGQTPISIQSFSSYSQIPPNLDPGFIGPNPWQFKATDNLGIGAHSLRFLTTGAGNCVVGPRCGVSLTTGSNNTVSGFQAGYRTTSGTGNTGYGCLALEHNTTGNSNSAFGNNALGGNQTGSGNAAFGEDCLWSFKGASYNAAYGHRALANGANNGSSPTQNTAVGAFSQDFAGGVSNSSLGYRALNAENVTGLYGSDNTVVGAFAARRLSGAASFVTVLGSLALGNEKTIGDLTAIGFKSLNANLGGTWNTGLGYLSVAANVTGIGNTGLGWSALSLNTSTVGQNTACGARSQEVSTSGANNTTLGFESGRFITTGLTNTLAGTRSGRSLTTGNDNVAIGSDSLQFETTGSTNSALGRGALRVMQDASNQVGVSNSTGVGANSRVSGSNQVQLGDAATAPYAHAALQIRSDERDKIGFRPLSKPLELIRGIEWCEFQKNERGLYFDEVVGTRMVSEPYESAFVDSDGRPILSTREVEEEYTYLVEVPNDGSRAGTRFHGGVKAQQVQALCESLGIDWAGLQHHAIKGGLDIFTVAYEALIPYLGHAVQHILERQDGFESRLAALEDRISV